jgi:hypothetical protein
MKTFIVCCLLSTVTAFWVTSHLWIRGSVYYANAVGQLATDAIKHDERNGYRSF